MRRFPAGWFVAVLTIVGVVVGVRLFWHSEAARYAQVEQVKNSASFIQLEMTVAYPAGRILEEHYTLVDDNGQSKATYAVTDRKGNRAHFDEYIHGYGVSFAFDKLVQDGIWGLMSKPPRGRDQPVYTVSIRQTVQREHGSRTVRFSDPEYWAKAREFHIVLDPKRPTPTQADLVKLQTTAEPDSRYLNVVNDFRTFGSPAFKVTIRRAREKLLAAHA